MKTVKEIRHKLRELTSDSRMKQPPADIHTNAPLALVQLEMESKINTLKWVLEARK